MKDFAREFLANLTPEEKRDWLKDLPKEIVWRMSEGNPHQTQDMTTNGKDLPTPILPLNHVRTDDRDAEDHGAHKAHQGAPGGDKQLEDGIDALIPDS